MPLGSYPMPSMFHIFDLAGKKLSIDNLITGTDKKVWLGAVDNELGRLAQGLPNKITGTSTINFIFKHKIPFGKKVTYANMVCDYRPLKEEKFRVRLTIGGDKLEYLE